MSTAGYSMSLTRKVIAFGTVTVPQAMMYRRETYHCTSCSSYSSLCDVTEANPCHSPTLHQVTWQYCNRKWRAGSWCDVRTLAVFSLSFSCRVLFPDSLALFAWQVNIHLPVSISRSRAVIRGRDWEGTNLSSLRTIKHYEFHPSSAFFLFYSRRSLSLSVCLCRHFLFYIL
jgi:hypothetical protein